MKSYLLLAIVISLNIACTKQQAAEDTEHPLDMDRYFQCRGANGIVNGMSLKPQDVDAKRAVLLIIRQGNSVKTCTGTAITENVILTAGHCLLGVEKANVYAVFHSDMTCASGYDSSMKVQSSDVLVHKDYKGDASAKSDLALVKLSEPIPANYPVTPIYDGKSPLSSDDVLMVGYGITSEKARDARKLRKVRKSFKKDSVVNGQNIIFDQRFDSGGVCSGDSGGPVYVKVKNKYQIIGVNSVVGGPDEETVCHNWSSAMYMPYFADWIQDSLRDLGP